MDLLGSILGKMDPIIPATKMDEETKKKVQEAKARETKFKDIERKRKANFKERIEAQVNKLLQGPGEVKKVIFEPMDQLHRSITHEVAEMAGLAAFSFGEEGIDRHIIVWKKEHSPSEDELEAIRNGEEYDPVKSATEKKAKAENAVAKEKENRKRNINPSEREQEKYFEKYAKIVGEDSGLDAAHTTKSNKTYGMVPSSNKEDTRSIEETMKQIRERKRQREMHGTSKEESTKKEHLSNEFSSGKLDSTNV